MNHITQAQAEALAHRRATKYTHRSAPNYSSYAFVPHTLMDFVLDIEAAAIQAHIDAQKASGWQLVPVEATPAMIDAGVASGRNRDWSYTTCYRAMLAAAPQGDRK